MRIVIISVAALGFLQGCASSSQGSGGPAPVAAAKVEYLVKNDCPFLALSVQHRLAVMEQTISAAAKEGWELVGMITVPQDEPAEKRASCIVVTFKRLQTRP